MDIGLIIIGDEILSGRREDKHLAHVIRLLGARGLRLDWAEYLGDDRPRIVRTLQRSFSGNDLVFCTGGIGATPDDHTRQAAAQALGVPLHLHEQARHLIEARMLDMARQKGETLDPDAPESQQRLRMGEFPQGAEIIPNPFNGIPGFSVRHHYFVPGFPEMAWPMIEWVLDTHFSQLFHQHPYSERAVQVFEAMEARLTPLMEALEQEFSAVKVFSLPHVGSERMRRHVELGVKGAPAEVDIAYEKMCTGLRVLGAEFTPLS